MLLTSRLGGELDEEGRMRWCWRKYIDVVSAPALPNATSPAIASGGESAGARESSS